MGLYLLMRFYEIHMMIWHSIGIVSNFQSNPYSFFPSILTFIDRVPGTFFILFLLLQRKNGQVHWIRGI